MKTLILLVGPTCSGKTTIEQHLNALGVPSVVSYTTRPPRAWEQHGKDYYFLSCDQVHELEREGRVVQKVVFSGNYYGSTVDSLDKAFAESDLAVMVVEPTGVTQFEAVAAKLGTFKVFAVYVDGPLDMLVKRLVNRWLMDGQTRSDYYWERLVQQVHASHNWPLYDADWSMKLDIVDDSIPGKTANDAAAEILGTIVR